MRQFYDFKHFDLLDVYADGDKVFAISRAAIAKPTTTFSCASSSRSRAARSSKCGFTSPTAAGATIDPSKPGDAIKLRNGTHPLKHESTRERIFAPPCGACSLPLEADGRARAAARSYLRDMSPKRSLHLMRTRVPLFPIIPLVPFAMLVGSFVFSALAFRGMRQLRHQPGAA